MKRPHKQKPPKSLDHKIWIPPVMVCCDKVEHIAFCIAENYTFHVKVTCKEHKTFFAENPLSRSRFNMTIELTQKFQRKLDRAQRKAKPSRNLPKNNQPAPVMGKV